VTIRFAAAVVVLVALSACGGSAATTQTPSVTASQGTPSPSASPPLEAKGVDLEISDLGPGYSVSTDAVDIAGIGWVRHFTGSATSFFEIVRSLTDVDPSPTIADAGQSLLVNQLISNGGQAIQLPSALPASAQAFRFTNSGLVGIEVIWTEQNLVCIVTVVPRPNVPSFSQIGDLASIQDGRAQAAVPG
jgi:hypothetical protein